MDNVRDIKIIGFDEKRPPLILKAPYINLFFKLSEEAPKDWCEDFNSLVKRLTYPTTIDTKECLFIETYVRKSKEIPPLLDKLKEIIVNCSETYMENIEAKKREKEAAYLASKPEANAEQDALDELIKNLNFDT